MSTTTAGPSRQERLQRVERRARRTERRRRSILAAVALAVVAIVAYGLLSAAPGVGTAEREAPDFTLQTTDGGTVTLSDLRGGPVLIYFNEGAGCASCTVQQAEIEKNPRFREAGITVLPVVMNTAEQIRADMERYGATTPYLLDDGTVSEAYGVLGTGMHEGLPGHGFVLVDADGMQRWQGSYPSMWLDPDELLSIVEQNL